MVDYSIPLGHKKVYMFTNNPHKIGVYHKIGEGAVQKQFFDIKIIIFTKNK